MYCSVLSCICQLFIKEFQDDDELMMMMMAHFANISLVGWLFGNLVIA